MSGRALAINAIWSLIDHLLFRGSLMLATIILARGLTTANFATYSYFQLTISMLAAYAAFGMGVAASRFFAQLGRQRDAADQPPISTLWLLSLLGSGLFACLVIAVPGGWLSAGLAVPGWFLALGCFVMAIGVVPGGAVIGLELFRQATFVSLLSGLVLLGGTAWAAKQGSAQIGMATLVVAFLFKGAGDALLVVREVGVDRLFGGLWLRQKDVRKVLGFAGPMLAVSLISGSGSWLLGRMILSRPEGDYAFAMYSIGLQWFSLALLFPGMLSRVILPRLVRAGSVGEQADVDGRALVRHGALMTVACAVAVTVAAVVVGPWLLQVYGDNYAVGRWFIGAFMLAGVLSAPANLLGNAIIARDGQMVWLLLMAAWLVVLLACGVFTARAGEWSGPFSQGFAAFVLTCLAFLVANRRRLV